MRSLQFFVVVVVGFFETGFLCVTALAVLELAVVATAGTLAVKVSSPCSMETTLPRECFLCTWGSASSLLLKNQA